MKPPSLQRLAELLVILLVAALLAAVLPGCVSLPKDPQQAVNKARAELIAVVRLNRSYMNEGIITPDKHDERLAKIEERWQELDDLEKLVRAGKGLEAKDRAEIIYRFALAIRADLAQDLAAAKPKEPQ